MTRYITIFNPSKCLYWLFADYNKPEGIEVNSSSKLLVSTESKTLAIIRTEKALQTLSENPNSCLLITYDEKSKYFQAEIIYDAEEARSDLMSSGKKLCVDTHIFSRHEESAREKLLINVFDDLLEHGRSLVPQGRPEIAMDEERFEELYALFVKDKISVTDMAEEFNVSTTTIYNRIKAYRQKNKI